MDKPHIDVQINRIDTEDPAIAKLRKRMIIAEEKKEKEKEKAGK